MHWIPSWSGSGNRAVREVDGANTHSSITTAALQKNDVYHYHHPGVMVQQKHRPPVREQKKRAGTMVKVQYDGRFVHHQQQQP